jgi:hypothetical protein
MDRERRIQHEKKSRLAILLNLSLDQPLHYPKTRSAVILPVQWHKGELVQNPLRAASGSGKWPVVSESGLRV